MKKVSKWIKIKIELNPWLIGTKGSKNNTLHIETFVN